MIDAQKPRLTVVAGPNGSGKTTITEKLLRHEWMGGLSIHQSRSDCTARVWSLELPCCCDSGSQQGKGHQGLLLGS